MLQSFRESIGRYVAVAILALIAVTFVFFGVDFSLTGTTFAAKVNGTDIPIFTFEQELQQQQSQYQQLYRIELTEDLRLEFRRNVLDQLVRTEALTQRAAEAGYTVSDQRLGDTIRAFTAFQVGGQFSMEVYRATLSGQGLTPAGFEALQRRQLALQELQGGIIDTTFLTPAEFRRYIGLVNERREVAYALFSVDDFLDQIEITDDAVTEHHAANGALYMSEETVDLEYIELSRASIAAEVDTSDDALRRYYEEQQDRFATNEERRVRHILITLGEGGSDEARARADAALERASGGEDFAALAAELSDDAGTSGQGGDLGWIARGTLEGPFEDALFAMQVDEISEVVESDFGYHVLRLDEVRAGDVQTFDEVRDELRTQYQDERAETLFFDRANQLADLAFDAYDALATVATEMGLPLQTAMAFPRNGDLSLFENSAPVVQAAFDAERLSSGTNSELVELADDHVVVLRVTAHEIPAPQPLEAVAEEIRAELARRAAEGLVAEAADAFMDAVELGAEDQAATEEHGGRWTVPMWTERASPDVPTEILAVAFGLGQPAAGSPIRELAPLANGNRAVLSLSAVEPGEPEAIPREARDERQRELAEQAAGLELSNYVEGVVDRATVRIPDEILNPQFF
ncbi:SurA N-terminal domain-containing protein [Candidatus Rariloculus sp.]|uniref:SurA N-terminal domain-containing protein n=1 Tax=Candidatus Rariloculus sp. TaxID=3101265 RepID=UPI003D12B937